MLVANRWSLQAGKRHPSAYDVWAPRVSTAQGIYGALSLVAMVGVIAMLVALAVWMWRSIAMLEERGDYSVGFGRTVAAWAWFVPFVNLFIPALVLYRLARAFKSRSDHAGWGAFGIVLIPVAGVVDTAAASVVIDDLVSHQTNIWWCMLGALGWLVGGVLVAELLRNLPGDTA
jgi:Domain of unknown function (DUF4328)